MLYKLIVALVVAQAAAFGVPAAAAGLTAGRASSVSMAEASWRRSFNGRGGGGAVAAPSAPSGVMTVPQACVFMEDSSVASVPYAEKKAFLLEKGVPEFVIIEAACTAPDSTLVL